MHATLTQSALVPKGADGVPVSFLRLAGVGKMCQAGLLT